MRTLCSNADIELIVAAREGNTARVRYLIAHEGANVKAASPGKGHFPLMWAVRTPDCTEALLDLGAAPNQTDCDGYTALIFAIHYGNTKSVKILLNRGANPTQKTDDGISPLELAKKTCSEMVPLIEDAIKAWPKVSGASNDAPVGPLGPRPAARVHRLAV